MRKIPANFFVDCYDIASLSLLEASVNVRVADVSRTGNFGDMEH